MRLFISINFNQKTKDNLLMVQSRLRELGRGNFTRPENLHLTLAFLGEVDESRVDDVKQVMDEIFVPKMKLVFSELGCFRGDSELWWIGARKNEQLLQLQKELKASLHAAGIWMDDKKFTPHITLVRQLHSGMIDRKKVLGKEFTTDVDAISLMLSERVDGKLKYTEIYRHSRVIGTRTYGE